MHGKSLLKFMQFGGSQGEMLVAKGHIYTSANRKGSRRNPRFAGRTEENTYCNPIQSAAQLVESRLSYVGGADHTSIMVP